MRSSNAITLGALAVAASTLLAVGISRNRGGNPADPAYNPAGFVASEVSRLATTGRPQVVEIFHYQCRDCQKMAPLVKDLEKQYGDRIDFVYLFADDKANAEAKRVLGFRSLPHFVFLSADGGKVTEMEGIISYDRMANGAELLASRR